MLWDTDFKLSAKDPSTSFGMNPGGGLLQTDKYFKHKLQMKKTIHIILTAVIALMAMSCMKDGETLIASLDGTGTQIGTADSDIVLTSENSSALALTIWWDRLGNATLSNPNAQMTDDVVVYAIQFSLSEDFGTYSEQSVSRDASNIQFTVGTLNNILYNLNAEGEVATSLYIRMCTSLGTNTDNATYGNTISITVTPYTVDMSKVRLVGVNSAWGQEVSIPVSSDNGNVYSGFAHIPAGWWNFFFVEGNGTIYGTYTDSDSNPFPLEQKTDMSTWNAWFPAPSGSYYVTLNTTGLWWECTSVSSMTLTPSGADALQMTYSSTNEAWYLVFTTTSDNQSIQVDYTGTIYNRSYGQNSEQGTSAAIAASGAGTSGIISSASSGTTTGITAGAAGTYTLIIRTSQMTWELHEGEVDINTGEVINWPEDPDYTAATSDNLYIYGLGSDGTPSASAGTLAQTGETGVYAGFFYMTSGYTFKLGDNETPASATVTYGATPSDTEGANSRLFCGSTMRSIQWTGSAAYVYITVNTNERSWSSTEVSSVIISGNFNGWSTTDNPMTFNSTDKTWSANITPGSWGDNGIQFLINGEWEHSYAPAAGGSLTSSLTTLIPDVEITAGTTYTVTIDLGAMTWKIEEYVSTGDNDEFMYVFYSWNTADGNYWPQELASTLRSENMDGQYRGYFSTPQTWSESIDACYYNFTFSTSSDATSGTRYGASAQDSHTLAEISSPVDGDAVWAAWPAAYGLTRLTVNMNDMTWSEETLPICVTGTFNNWSLDANPMQFDLDTRTWKATCEIGLIEDGVQIVLGSDWEYVYGGTDGTLYLSGTNIIPDGTGTYVITVDLRNASDLTYTLARQE